MPQATQSWTECQSNYQTLQGRFEKSASLYDANLVADAVALRQQLQQRHAERSTAVREQQRFDPAQLAALQAKSDLIDEYLTLGRADLPEGASAELRKIADCFTHRIMAEDLLAELQKHLADHTQVARQVAGEVEHLERQATRKRSQRELLGTLEELLDSLLGVEVGGVHNP
jgi:hypothetical protein